MKNRLKKLAQLKGKKRYLLVLWLGLELLSLPAAAAQIMNRVSFKIPPIVNAVEIPTSERGVSRFLVSSNSGFSVTSSDIIGEIHIEVHVSGTLHGTSRFGDAAQLPGPKNGCAQANGLGSNVYLAEQKTANTPGSPVQQAVIIEFTYDAAAQPRFKFTPGADVTATLESCQGATS
jgi:hypothetical protein